MSLITTPSGGGPIKGFYCYNGHKEVELLLEGFYKY